MGYEQDKSNKAMDEHFISRGLAPIDQVSEGLSMGLLAQGAGQFKNHEIY
jgi:hypothetical protein